MFDIVLFFTLFNFLFCEDFDYVLNEHRASIFKIGDHYLAPSEYDCQVRNNTVDHITGANGFLNLQITDYGCPLTCGTANYRCSNYRSTTLPASEAGFVGFTAKLPPVAAASGSYVGMQLLSSGGQDSISIAMYGADYTVAHLIVVKAGTKMVDTSSGILPSSFQPDVSNEYQIVFSTSLIRFYLNGELLHEVTSLAEIPITTEWNVGVQFYEGSAASSSYLGTINTSPFVPIDLKVSRIRFIAGLTEAPGDGDDNDDGKAIDDGIFSWIGLTDEMGYVVLGVGAALILCVVVTILSIIICIICGKVLYDDAQQQKKARARRRRQRRRKKNKGGRKRGGLTAARGDIKKKLRTMGDDSDSDDEDDYQQEAFAKRMTRNFGALFGVGASDKPECSKIMDGLFIGNEDGANDRDLLKAKGINAVVNVSTDLQNPFDDDLIYYNINVEDEEDAQLFQFFGSFYDVIDEDEGPYYVHSNEGNSRVPTLIIAYLMNRNRWKCQEAWNYVKKRRRNMNPNEEFINQLNEYETFLFGNDQDKRKTRFFDESNNKELRKTQAYDSQALNKLRQSINDWDDDNYDDNYDDDQEMDEYAEEEDENYY